MPKETEKEPEVKVEYPNIVERFREVFQKLGIKKSEGYVDHCAKGELENLEDVEQKLYEMGLHPSLRNQVINFWAAEIKAPLPEKLRKRIAEESGAKVRGEKEKREAEGAVWTVDVDDKGMPKIRMIKSAEEPGTTLEVATKAAKEIGKEYGGDESLVIFNETLGKHMPNFKSDFVKRNLGVAWQAANQMDKAMAEGITVDPMDTFVEQMAKVESMKELVGAGKKEPEAKGTIAEIISGLKELRAMAGEGQQLPEWMRDPVAFQRTIQELTPKGEGEGLKELRDEITRLREEQHQAELSRRNEQIHDLTEVVKGYKSEFDRLKTEVERAKQVTGRTAYDLLGDLVKKVPDREDIREMVREAVSKGPKLLARGAKEREGILEGMATSMEEQAGIKAIEDDWWRLK